MNDTPSAFWYVDGEPIKGIWLDMDLVDDTDEVLEALAKEELIARNDDDEPDYDGDLLVADAEGLAAAFTGSHGSFDMIEFCDCRDYCDRHKVDHAAAVAYVNWAGSWSRSGFADSYYGEADSEVKFAQQLLEDSGDLNSIPDHLQMYFDYESYTRDLFTNDFHFEDGYVFRNN